MLFSVPRLRFLLLRSRLAGRNLLDAIATLPLAIPGVVLAVGYLRVFHGWDFPGLGAPLTSSWLILVIAYTMRRLPYTVRACYAALQQVHISLEESAQSLGANRLQTFAKITLPLISGGLVAGGLIGFVTSCVELSSTIMLVPRIELGPISYGIYIYMQSPLGRGAGAALGVVAILLVSLGTYLTHRIFRRSRGQRLQDLTMMQPAEVRLDGIGKSYGEQWVVRDVNLHIRRGEFFTFLGPSGCGKTTLLRIIAGFVFPDEGTVSLDGQPVNHVPPWQRNVGLVFQNYALWPHMTVFENVAFGLRERKVARSEIEPRVMETLKQVDLQGTENRRPSQLSGGQQQRVALARTLVIQPRLLLLDEPLSNLDAKLRIDMRIELLKLQHDLGLTTIYVTHDQEEALALSTRIAVMNGGRVVQEGTSRQIYEQPANEFVAAFVGQSNLFSGKVFQTQERFIEIQTDDNLIIRAASPPSATLPHRGAKILLSVRPEAMELRATTDSSQGANQLMGHVTASAYQGAFVEYEIQLAERTLKTYAVNPKGNALFQPGQEVVVIFPADDVVVVRND